MLDPLTIVAVFATFLIAGAVKGVIGLGLPTISLALLTVAIDLPSAMALLLVPSFVTNLWQATIGGEGKAIVRRLWPFLLMGTVTVWLGSTALTRIDLAWLSALLGALLITYAAVSLAGVRPAITSRQELWLGPLLGAALQGNDLLSIELGTMSAVALLPAIIGMALGQRIRRRLSEQRFRRVFFVSLLMLGGYIIANAVGGLH